MRFAATAGSATAFFSSALSLSIIGRGVPAGTNVPNHEVMRGLHRIADRRQIRKLRKRFSEDTAIARTRFACMCGSTSDTGVAAPESPRRPRWPRARLLVGHVTMLTFAMLAGKTRGRCWNAPTPAEP